ncbi:hypothetical protein [Nitrosococcus watsonii]|uniref:Phospholipase A2 n=1 Tax=Nitrosococcus watsoni (strain C-113) TaxID=105559 RepID=D8K7G4_NITWC|nr:hypothetical protein [Nitrosococcus watsonii]ADJ28841.1 conserved hypothetical protein [Nitrosococcus watsonii C-113]
MKLQIFNGVPAQLSKLLLSLMAFTLIPISACSSHSPCDPDFLPATSPSPPNECRVDGCSLAPDFDFGYCCNQHDARYWSGGTTQERKQADLALRQCLAEANHEMLAVLYYYGVRIGGTPYLPTPWRWGFGWNYPQYQLNHDAESN